MKPLLLLLAVAGILASDVVHYIGDEATRHCAAVAKTLKCSADDCTAWEELVESSVDQEIEKMMRFFSSNPDKFLANAKKEPFNGKLADILRSSALEWLRLRPAERDNNEVQKSLLKSFYTWFIETAVDKPGFGSSGPTPTDGATAHNGGVEL